MAKPKAKQAAAPGDDFFEFEGANIHPSAKDPKKTSKAASQKSSKKPSPYTKREFIVPQNSAAGADDTYDTDITRDTLRDRARGRSNVPEALLADALRRKHGIHRAEPEKEGVFTKIANRLRTKTVSGVKIVGAKKIEVTKLSEKQLHNQEAIDENLAMMEDMDDLGLL